MSTDTKKLAPLTPDLYHYERNVEEVFKTKVPWLKQFKIVAPPKDERISVRKENSK